MTLAIIEALLAAALVAWGRSAQKKAASPEDAINSALLYIAGAIIGAASIATIIIAYH